MTAIGVTSIVVASLSLLSALWVGLMFVPMAMMSTMVAAAPMAPSSATTPANTISAADAELIASTLEGRQPLSQAEHAALVRAIQIVEMPLSPPLNGQWTADHVATQLIHRNTSDDGQIITTSFQFNNGDISLSTGTVSVNVWHANGDWSSTTVSGGAITSSTTTNMAASSPFPGMTPWVVMLYGAGLVLNLGLAVLLLIAGIQMLRSSPSGRTLHLWWAIPKIAAAVLWAVATYHFWGGVFTGSTTNPTGEERLVAAIVGGGGLVIALAWPVTVLFLLRARSLREYYSPPEATIMG